MTLQEDYNYHKGSFYSLAWQNILIRHKSWDVILHYNNVKLRIFDHIYDQVFFEANGENIFVSLNKTNESLNKNNLPIDSTFQSLWVKFSFTPTIMRIRGFYRINNYLVLCACPDARTLVKSYYNNPQETKKKIKKISSFYSKDRSNNLILNAIKLVNNT